MKRDTPLAVDVEMLFLTPGAGAQLTGGKCLSVRDLSTLGTLVNKEPVTTTVRSERSLWDNWMVAAVLVVLLGMEWMLRRKHDLT